MKLDLRGTCTYFTGLSICILNQEIDDEILVYQYEVAVYKSFTTFEAAVRHLKMLSLYGQSLIFANPKQREKPYSSDKSDSFFSSLYHVLKSLLATLGPISRTVYRKLVSDLQRLCLKGCPLLF